MQIAPVGALEVALANLTTSMATQQQIAAGAAAQPGNRMAGAAQEKQAASKSKSPERSQAASPAAEQAAQSASGAQSAKAGQSTKAEPTQPIVERQLFDYLTEVEKSGGGPFTDPSALFGSAVHSLEGTMQKVQKALGDARPPAGEADVAAGQDAAAISPDKASDASAENAPDTRAKNAEQLLERSISVMWAAANLEVVMSSVTAVTSSTSTLIKQQ
jgi:hypothetical protein